MSPTQTSGRDSFGWRFALPFFAIADPRAAQRTVMASKTATATKSAVKSKAKHPAAKKAPEKPKSATKPAAPAKVVPVRPAAKPGAKPTPAEAAKLKAGNGKPPVSNVEAIKAVAIKAAAKGAVPAAAADKDAGETTDSPLLDLSDAAVRKMIKQ